MATKPLIGERLKAFQQSEAERILGACTSCGRCYEVCPMAQYAKPSGEAKSVVPGVLAMVFGHAQQRLAGLPRLMDGLTSPDGTPLTEADIPFDPHPFP